MMNEHPNPARRWQNRRRMAWASVFGGLVGYPLVAAFEPELVEIAMPFYLFVGTVVGAYIGGVVVDDKNQMQAHK